MLMSFCSLVVLLLRHLSGGVEECARDSNNKFVDDDDDDAEVETFVSKDAVDIVVVTAIADDEARGDVDANEEDNEAIAGIDGRTAGSDGGGNNVGNFIVVMVDGEGVLANCGDCFRLGLGELELTMLPAPGLVVPAS